MKRVKCALGAAFLVGTAVLQPVQALERTADTSFTPVFGSTLPPIGYVRFCSTNPMDCVKTPKVSKHLDLTPERWQQLYQINTMVNSSILPASDQEIYGKPEVWAYPTRSGDCEDYLLLKKKYLQNLGFSPSVLLITVVLDEKNEGHAVLTVVTSDGDYVLDNRRNDILRWNATGYTFLKRQTQNHPKQWVALTKSAPRVSAAQMGSRK